MIYNVADYDIDSRRAEVLKYLGEQKFERVLDIGGACNPWASDFTTHYIDINQVPVENKVIFLGDINEESGWAGVLADVEAYGKFEFIICTHVLEDIRNPVCVLNMMPRIAKGGFVSLPNKHSELTCRENSARSDMNLVGLKTKYHGYCHHRWIGSLRGRETKYVFCLYPKLEFVFCIDHYEWVDPLKNGGELGFWWRDSIKFKMSNNDFIGPSPIAVFDRYRRDLKKGL